MEAVVGGIIVKKPSNIVLSGGSSLCSTRNLIFEDNCQQKCAHKTYRKLRLTTPSSASPSIPVQVTVGRPIKADSPRYPGVSTSGRGEILGI